MSLHINAAVDVTPHKCGFSDPQTQHTFELLRQGHITDQQRPDLPEFLEDFDTTIRVHYTRTGDSAVPLIDEDLDGVPDYVNIAMGALLYARRLYLDSMQYWGLLSDDRLGGSGALDVYLVDLSEKGTSGTGMYGRTEPETRVNNVQPYRYTSWIEIDNDFSPDDRNVFDQQVFATFGTDGLRVTCSHELYHSVQLAGYGDASVQKMVYEMSAVWMEIRTWPNIYDWINYTQHLLGDPRLWPFSDASSTNGYAWGWFGNLMSYHQGDLGMRYLFERIRDGQEPYAALVDACSQNGRDFNNDFCNDIVTLYHTGSRSATNTFLPRADSLNEITLAADDIVQSPSHVQTGSLRAYEVHMLRYSIPSIIATDPPFSVVFSLVWADTKVLFGDDAGARTQYQVLLSTSSSQGATPIIGTAWYFEVVGDNVCYAMEGASTARTESPYPQPLVLSKTQTVYIPVYDAIPGDDVEVSLMTVQTLGIKKETTKVILDNTRIVIPFTVPSDLVSGTYLIDVGVGEKHTLVKISIK